MSTFSEVLTEYIKARHVKVAPMTKYCGIDRSTMYKLISGKRNPPSKDIFEKMAQFMHLTPAETQRFEEAWEVTVIGPEVYYKRKSVENFIRHFPSHFSVSPDEFIFSSKLIQNNQESDCTVLTSLQNVNYFIHKMFLAEASRSSGKISLFLQPDHEFVFHLLSTLAPSDTLEVQHILCLNSEDTFTEQHELVNLKYLDAIFPIYMSGLNYTLWYYYDNIPSHYQNMNIFPCMILTSDAALMCTADGQSGIFYRNSDVIHMLQEMYNTYLEQCSQLFLPTAFLPDNFSNVFNTIFEVSEEAPTFALQPEVCITPFISEKILKQAFNYDIPHSEEIIKQAALAFRGNMKRLTDSQTYVYFTADGLLQFATSGRTAEIPEVFYHKFTVEHRIEMLHGVAESCRKGSYRILQKPLNHLPSNLHLCIRGNVGTLIFQKYNGEVMLFTIQEYGLLETFLDYLQNMLESSFYTSEEAAAYVESIIYQLENGELS